MRVRLVAALVCLVLSTPTLALAATATPVLIDDTNVFPESMTATAAGDLIVGSSAKGAIYRAPAGASKASLWIDPNVSGMVGVFGVFADEASHTLFACSVPFAPPERADALSALRTFDLKTGAPKGNYPLPGGAKALCNDIAVAKDGTVYVSETRGGRVLRLKRGATALTEWIADPQLASVDGIAMGGDGAVYVNTVATGHMFRIRVDADGSAGLLTPLQTSVPLGGPDGLRSIGGSRFLQAENKIGRVSEVTISGDTATVTPLKSEAGVVGVAMARGQVWTIDAKFGYRRDPALKDKDPNPFTIDPVETPAGH